MPRKPTGITVPHLRGLAKATLHDEIKVLRDALVISRDYFSESLADREIIIDAIKQADELLKQ